MTILVENYLIQQEIKRIEYQLIFLELDAKTRLIQEDQLQRLHGIFNARTVLQKEEPAS